ncbi:MAG: alpha/beta hydrolase [Candidatus Promineifilaceae bacterium]
MQLHTVTLFNRSQRPCSLVTINGEEMQSVPFTRIDHARIKGEYCWRVQLHLPHSDDGWAFRIAFADGTFAAPYRAGSFDPYQTTLTTLWIQQGQVFGYEPQPILAEPRVVKISNFFGSLPKRPVYLYLPRGYDQHHEKTYPVIYMHDGQNCFEQFAHDSFSGSWRADHAADWLIASGKMRECVIVAVGNGGGERIAEYLPDYAVFRPNPDQSGNPFNPIHGRASQTIRYYVDEIAPFIEQHYRVASERSQRATLGSSMGGLFTTYLAWEHTAFAQHHAALSSSYWITEENEKLAIVERLRHDAPRDIRLWLDSGTQDSGGGDDGLAETIAARDALRDNGYQLGPNLHHYIHQDAGHHESAWAERLPLIFQFLFPI